MVKSKFNGFTKIACLTMAALVASIALTALFRFALHKTLNLFSAEMVVISASLTAQCIWLVRATTMPKVAKILFLVGSAFFVVTFLAMVWFCVVSLDRPAMSPAVLVYASPCLGGAVCVGLATVISKRDRRARACQSEKLA